MESSPPSVARPRSKRSLVRILGNLGASAVGILAAVLLIEVGLRIAGYPPSFFTPDPQLGDRLRPGAYYRWTIEGFSSGHLNREGWRDRDYPVTKPPGTTRILFLGDSYTAAFEVPLDSTYHKRLERALNARALPGHHFEVLGIGRPGFGTTDEYISYLRWGSRYDPDVVAVLFVPNDWADNWPGFWNGNARPVFRESGDSLHLDTSFAQTANFRRHMWLAPLREHSSLAPLLARFVQVARIDMNHNTEVLMTPGRGGWYNVWNFLRSPPVDSIPAFPLTGRILDRFARRVRGDGHQFVLVPATMSETADYHVLEANLRDPGFDPSKWERALVAAGDSSGYPVVSMTQAFLDASRDGRRLWFGSGKNFGHWNSAGHALAARFLTDYFSARLPGLSPTPTR